MDTRLLWRTGFTLANDLAVNSSLSSRSPRRPGWNYSLTEERVAGTQAEPDRAGAKEP